MDSIRLSSDARDRALTHSRASTDPASSFNTPTCSSNRSSYYTPRPTPHAHFASSSTSARVPSRLPRPNTAESQRMIARPMSGLLQERLERERKNATNRVEQMKEDLSTASTSVADMRDLERDTHNSPIRRSATDVALRGRQRHVGDHGSSDHGFALKADEKRLETLSSQNFDLKLEVFHRRERQSRLEEKNEELKSWNIELRMAQEGLVAELEMRDKAIDEAVHRIAMLEVEVEQLRCERDMVQQVEVDNSYEWSAQDDRNGTPTPRAKPTPAHWNEEARCLNHMPSFLSEHSEITENLRNVMMARQSSPIQSRKVSEVSASSADASDMDHRLASPSMSMLSESSFVSVYRGNDEQAMAPTPSPPQFTLAESSSDKIKTSTLPRKKRNMEDCKNRRDFTPNFTPSRVPKGPSKRVTSHSPQMASLGNVLDSNSPIPHGESVAKALVATEASSPHDTERASDMRYSSFAPGFVPQSQIKTKEEKREALNKTPGTSDSSARSREARDDRGLPPTPDTVSTSTLRRLHTAKDIPSSDRHLAPEGSFVEYETSVADFAPKTPLRQTSGKPSQPASTTAFTGRRMNGVQPRVDANLFASQASPAWPRSAEKATSSATESGGEGTDSSSESDDEGVAEAGHLESNFDPWTCQDNQLDQIDRDASPDLFSFPEGSHSWNTDAFIGNLQGALSTPVAGLERDHLEGTRVGGIRLVTPQKPLYQPPAPKEKDGGFFPPSRRSSLHARTGSLPQGVIALDVGRTNSLAKQNSARGSRGRSSSIDFAAVSTTTQAPNSLRGRSNSKRSQYPPITGQCQSSRGRPGLGWGKGGLHGLFKRDRSGSRSRGETGSRPTSAAGVPFTAVQSGRNSVPPPAIAPWTRPARLVEAPPQGSATPPPIMRNRPPPPDADYGFGQVDGTASPEAYQSYDEVDAKVPMHVVANVDKVDSIPPAGGQCNNNTPQSSGGGGGKRWWTGLGRRNSVKPKGT